MRSAACAEEKRCNNLAVLSHPGPGISKYLSKLAEALFTAFHSSFTTTTLSYLLVYLSHSGRKMLICLEVRGKILASFHPMLSAPLWLHCGSLLQSAEPLMHARRCLEMLADIDADEFYQLLSVCLKSIWEFTLIFWWLSFWGNFCLCVIFQENLFWVK